MTYGGPMLELFLKDVNHGERTLTGTALEELQREGPHAGAGKECEEEGVAGTNHYELTTAISNPSAILWVREMEES